jgi:hypothetical protein
MKTILDIDDELLVRAEAVSVREHKSLTAVVEEGLRLRLEQRTAVPLVPGDLPVFGGCNGLAEGIDPSSNRSLYDAADAGL